MNIIKRNKNEILVHIIVWIAILMVMIVPYLLLDEKRSITYYWDVKKIISFSFTLFQIYFYYIFIMNVALRKRSFKLFVVYSSLALVTLMILKVPIAYLFEYLFNDSIILFKNISEIKFSDFALLTFFKTGLFAFIGVITRFIVEWFRSEKQKDALKHQNFVSEMALLRQQINPHFLFNTLNNIYSLAYKKSDNTADSILKLSGIMRYMLYESNTDFVDCKDEINYLNSYIELELLRMVNKDLINYKVSGDYDSLKIAPMLFVPFVENAFKHSASQQPIDIDINFTSETISLKVSNKLSEKYKSVDSCGGIGLNNVQRRLDLIYPDKHKLNIEKNNTDYSVELKIENV